MDRHEHQFAIGRLPHQEIRKPLLAAGANDQVGIGNFGRVEVSAQRVGIDRLGGTLSLGDLARQTLGGVGDFLARSVVERDHEIEPGIAPGQLFRLVQQRADIRLQSVALTDDPDPDAIAVQCREVVADEAPEQTEEIADLARRTRPVLRAEGEDRQIEDAELVGCANHPPQRLDATAMAFRARQAAGGRPASVAVHNDRHMQRRTGGIRGFGRRGGSIRHRLILAR